VSASDDAEELSRLVREINTSTEPQRPEPSRPRTDGEGRYIRDHASHDHAPHDHASHERDTGAGIPSPARARLDGLLEEAVRRGASDLLLVAGVPPSIRRNGALEPAGGGEPLAGADTRAFVLDMLDELRYREFLRTKAADFTFERPAIGRFRCNLHHQRGTVAVAIRILPLAIPTLSELSLPAVYERFTTMARGLVLFCGPTGCGKSTSMASLIDVINRTRASHVVTIESPVEHVHRHRRSIVEQVEVGVDAVSFASALRHALRQNPDVILVGEMRDLETISTAITAAETGHLVFSTLHTSDASQTIDRMIDVFPEGQQNQIRQQISLSLAGIAVQTLVPRSDGDGRVPACEVLLANDAVRNLIRTGKNHQIHSQITIGRREGMITMEESLAGLVKVGRISRDEARLRAPHRDELDKHLD
jgi:twitching motility protein PilT